MEINGVYRDFRLYDSDQEERKNRYFDELKKMQKIAVRELTGSEREKNECLCNSIKMFFDNVFGAGTGKAVCGTGNDLLMHLEAFNQLVEEQVSQNNRFKSSLEKMKMLTNRLMEQ